MNRECASNIMKHYLAVALLLITGSAQAVHQVKGRLEWLERVEMRAVETGVVEEVLVAPGEHVKKGDLLLRMDRREADARLLETKAEVARAELRTQSAERELDRAQELFERGLIAVEELKDAELKLALAKAEEQAARAAEVAAQVVLERSELRAPFDGILVARNVWKGDVVYKTLQQEPLLVIAPNKSMLARALVTADVLRRYRPGQRVRIDIHGRLREGTVYSLGVEAVRVEITGAVYELDVIFDVKSGELLRPSESISIVLP
jgi:RND family efflux transporter MFP subunit